MKHIMRTMAIAAFSSVFVMQGACTISGDGISIIPTVSLNTFLAGLPFIGGLVT